MAKLLKFNGEWLRACNKADRVRGVAKIDRFRGMGRARRCHPAAARL
jgi:hypothetical protein